MAEVSATQKNKTVELGFLEECESWLLTNTYFPSKVGGKPAWLELENVPSLEDMKCRRCKEPLVFLCQVFQILCIFPSKFLIALIFSL